MASHQLVDRICSHYRKAWRYGNPRPIEELLASVKPAERSDLLVKLIIAEAELRSESGDQATAEEFERRFPQDRELVAQAMSVIRKHLRAASMDETKPFSGTLLPARSSLVAGSQANLSNLASPSQKFDASAENLEGYELLEEIGHGGMGVVYKARQKRLGRIVALKVIRTDRAPRPEEIQRFERETAAAARLDHPGIVGVYDAGKMGNSPFYVMAYVAGSSLAQRLTAGPLPTGEAVRLTRQIADAIGYAHRQGVVHRDLKPANVLIDEEGRARVTDFGLAMLLDADSRITASGMVVGSFPYMAPEQALGRHSLIGPATDIYSVGIILYMMLSGMPPFTGDDPISLLDKVKFDPPAPVTSFRSDVSPVLAAIVQRCLAKAPENRFKSAEELVAALDRILQGDQSSFSGVSTTPGFFRRAWNRFVGIVARLAASLQRQKPAI